MIPVEAIEGDSMASRVPLASTEQLAEHLGVPVKTLELWRYKGTGPKYLRVGKYVRYRWADVETWLAGQECVVQAV